MNIMAPAQTFSTKNTAPVVQVRGLSRRYGKGPVILDHLDLEIGAGEFIALLGRSGSGKSTLLRTLAGLDAVTEGTVIRPKEVAVVFQESRLLPWKRVWQNILLGMGKNAVHEEDAHKALQEVGLSHRATAWPLTLSGGEAQRAALARALVRNPSFLMLDEPFAALDALTRIRMQQLVARLWEKHKSAVLLVTHDVDEALMLADRVVVLESGRIHTEISVPLERPRRHANPIFEDLRRTLLSALGVTPD